METEDATREDVMELFGEDAPAEILDEFPEETPGTPDDEGDPDPKLDAGDDAGGDSDGDDTPKDDLEDPKNTDDDPGDDEESDILSKSGKYTIPYEKLTEARDNAKASKESEDAALSKVSSLEAELEALKKGGEGEGDKPGDDGNKPEDLDELEEEFPGVAKTIKSLQDQIETLTKANQSAAVKNEEVATVDHFTAIENAHENSQEMLQSREFETWLGAQTSIMKNAYASVFEKGSTEEVIEMLDTFVGATESETPDANNDDTAGKDDGKAAEALAAKIAAAKAKDNIPNSLSDVPGAPNVTDPVEMLQASSNSGKAVDDLFAGKTPDQIDALVSKLL